ncbi:RNA 2',3'-cyclic phosphodiesterase [Candidatus Uhrbacteria bacterium]|nr:RNA 2',3'-cyclic phosphodiesterase [Candidatus Uhrbacteria bacterium]
MKRIFFAIPLTVEIQQRLSLVQGDIRRQLQHSRVAWVSPCDMHITLHFLGEVSVASILKLVQEVRKLSLPDAFSLSCGDVDAFPSKKNPETIIVRTHTHTALSALRQRLGTVIVSQGLTMSERAFHPHVTLGRVRSSGEVLQPEQVSPLSAQILIGGFTLFESKLTPDGPVYSALEHFPIG